MVLSVAKWGREYLEVRGRGWQSGLVQPSKIMM